jgi:predicted ABC-type ATPase
MSQPVKLSDALVLDARLAAEVVERSIAGQVEFWASLGRGVELLLQTPQVLTLCRNAAARPLSACLGSVDSPAGWQRVTDFLQSQPFPHYRRRRSPDGGPVREPPISAGQTQDEAENAVNLPLDQRPIVVAVAGPNGAGKSTFYHAHLQPAGLRFVNADVIARELKLEPYAAAGVADAIRRELLRQRESFIFETVFSDPAGDKLTFLQQAAEAGYTVLLCFIGISGPAVSDERVAMRVTQGGHAVPSEKLVARYPRILANLKAALGGLPHVWIFDNEDLSTPFRLLAVFQDGERVQLNQPVPRWLRPLLPGS